MSRPRLWIALESALFVLCAALPALADLPPSLPANEEAAAALLEIAGEGFRIRESDHFTIAYDTDAATVGNLINRLEGTFDAIWRFCQGLELPVRQPGAKFNVLFFDREEDFARYCAGFGFSADSAAGVYRNDANLSAFCNTLNRSEFRQVNDRLERIQASLRRMRKDRSNSPATRSRRKSLARELAGLRARRDAASERFNRLVIQHEATHHMLFNIGVHVPGAVNPTWVAEGLACQFEVPQVRPGTGLHGVNHVRLADFRNLFNLGPRARTVGEDEYRRGLTTERLIPLAKLISDSSLFRDPKVNHGALYAEAWALVYYLQREHRDAFSAYLRRLAARKPGEAVDAGREMADFEVAFGPLSDEFGRAWVGHIVRLHFDPRQAGR